MAETYVVTGASRGLGLGLVERILEVAGTHAIAAARSPESSKGLQDLAQKYEGRLTLIKCDTTDESSVEAAAREVEKLHPDGIDYLINNAGISGGAFPALQTPAQTMMEVYKTNTIGPFICSRAFHPLLLKKQRRVIVNISSRVGSITDKVEFLRGIAPPAPLPPLPARIMTGALAYSCSKAGLNMETAVLANALKEDHFIVITMCPGWVATDMGSAAGEPPLDVMTSTTSQMKIIKSVTLADSGKYYDSDTKAELRW